MRSATAPVTTPCDYCPGPVPAASFARGRRVCKDCVDTVIAEYHLAVAWGESEAAGTADPDTLRAYLTEQAKFIPAFATILQEA